MGAEKGGTVELQPYNQHVLKVGDQVVSHVVVTWVREIQPYNQHVLKAEI
jgi:2-succinyl-5-enolpyruvyl-6-hydroxy-3-cyclohexene-1-carboxylate synthase